MIIKHNTRELTGAEINNSAIKTRDSRGQEPVIKGDCGIIHRWDYNKGVWYVFVPKLWLDSKPYPDACIGRNKIGVVLPWEAWESMFLSPTIKPYLSIISYVQ